MNQAWISLGANLGDPETSLRKALDRLSLCTGVILDAVSSFYKSAAVDYQDQPNFVNAVARIQTQHNPESLLGILQDVERQGGQTGKTLRFGPRLLDLDLLLYEDFVCTSSCLILPHPRMHLRRFVLVPLCEINPKLRHPVLQETMKALLEKITENSQWVERIQCPALSLP